MNQMDKYFDAVRSMFLTEGWALFLEDLSTFVSEANDVRHIADAEDLFYKQGQINVAEFVLGFEKAIEASQQAQEDEKEGEE